MQVIKLNGDHLTFKGRVYGSVSIEYRIEYDKTAFQVEYNYKFVHSEKRTAHVMWCRRFYCNI